MNPTWFRLFRRPEASRPARAALGFRPSLEGLEERAAPSSAPASFNVMTAFFLPFQTAVANYSGLTPNPPFNSAQVNITYNPFQEMEAVTLSGLSPASGTVSITDGGQTHTAGVSSNGTASTTFTFNLLQALAGAHTIGASDTPTSGGASFSTSLSVPSTTTLFNNEVVYDWLVISFVFGALGHGGTSGMAAAM